jgi:FkbM family methyltransferase
MIKGKWIVNLIARIVDGSISYKEALSFIGWRFGRRKRWLEIEGISFENIDRVTWGLISGILVNREYNPSGYEIGPDDSVVDIGAHRGVFLTYAAKRTQSQILAIEPDPENYRRLQSIIEKNGFRNTKLMNVAVAAKSGDAYLYRASASSRHTLVGIDQWSGESLEDSIVVTTVTLDDVLASFPVVHYLKMDCEGAEYSILNSASDETISKIQRLVVELHGLDEAGVSDSIEERLELTFADISIIKTSPKLGLLYARKVLA